MKSRATAIGNELIQKSDTISFNLLYLMDVIEKILQYLQIPLSGRRLTGLLTANDNCSSCMAPRMGTL